MTADETTYDSCHGNVSQIEFLSGMSFCDEI